MWVIMLGFNVVLKLSGSPVLCSVNSLTNVICGSWQRNLGSVQLSKFSVSCLLWLYFLRLGTANSTANLLDDVEGNPCGKTFLSNFPSHFFFSSLINLSSSLTETSGNPCFHCYTIGGAIPHLLKAYRSWIITQAKKKSRRNKW